MKLKKEKKNIIIFDTTLRDGEQCPGASMSTKEKLQIAEVLDEMKVDIIEAGFPVASPGDFQAVMEVSKILKYSRVCALTRAKRGDIDKAVAALAHSDNKRIHTFISTSPLHMQYKLRMAPEEVYEAIVDSVSYARNFVDDVEWSCEDGTRSDLDFLCKCFEAAINAGAKTVNIADTVGYIQPSEFKILINYLFNNVPNMDKARFSVHCHDDLGLATANSITAIENGATQIECTINGLGERAGNASLEETVMNIKTHEERLGCQVNLNTTLLTKASQLVSRVTGFNVPPNKAIVGSNAFAHESGIHQHGVIRHRGTYEIISPEVVGADGSEIILGKHSGRHALRMKLEGLGFTVSQNALDDIFIKFKHVADKEKCISDHQLMEIVGVTLDKKEDITLVDFLSQTDENKNNISKITLRVKNEMVSAEAQSNDIFQNIADCITHMVPHACTVTFTNFQGRNEDNTPKIKVLLKLTGKKGTTVGQGISQDPCIAYILAYLQSLHQQLGDEQAVDINKRKVTL